MKLTFGIKQWIVVWSLLTCVSVTFSSHFPKLRHLQAVSIVKLYGKYTLTRKWPVNVIKLLVIVSAVLVLVIVSVSDCKCQ